MCYLIDDEDFMCYTLIQEKFVHVRNKFEKLFKSILERNNDSKITSGLLTAGDHIMFGFSQV